MSASGASIVNLVAELAAPDSELRRSLSLAYQRARLDVDPDDLPGPVPLASSGQGMSDARLLRERARRSREVERAEAALEQATENVKRFGATFADDAANAARLLSRLESRGLTDLAPEDGIRLAGRVDADPWLVLVEALTAGHRLSRMRASQGRASLALAGLRPARTLPTQDPFLPPEAIELVDRELERLWAMVEPFRPRQEKFREPLEDVKRAGFTPRELERVEPPTDLDGPRADVDGLRRLRADFLSDQNRRIALWHWQRARGQARRFGTLAACGTGDVVSHCSACGVIHEGREHCDIGRLCHPCKARQGKGRKVRFSEAQDRVLRQAKHAQLDRGKHRFTVRHMTLTVPHRESQANRAELEVDGGYATAARRVNVLFRAWRHFSLEMQAWARDVRNLTGQRIEWYRSFEWTPAGADDGMGHPHFHVWIFCPYPPRGEQAIAEWWSAALAREEVYISPEKVIVGLREAPDAWIVHEVGKGAVELVGEPRRGDIVRRVHGSDRIIRYIEGWSLTDVDENGAKMDPRLAAAVYGALEGKRLVQTSRGFLTAKPPGCGLCGELGAVRTRIVRGLELAERRAAIASGSVWRPGQGWRSGADPPPQAT